MNTLKRVFFTREIDRPIAAVAAILAVLIGILDIFDVITQFSPTTMLKFAFITTGILLGATAFRAAREAEYLDGIKTSIDQGTRKLQEVVDKAKITQLGMYGDFPPNIASRIRSATAHYETMLCRVEERPSPLLDRVDYYKELEKRLKNKALEFRQVVIIYSRQDFELILNSAMLFERESYFLRYYPKPEKAVPVMNMMVFDNRTFFIGGYHLSDPGDPNRNVVWRLDPSEEMSGFLREYWSHLWDNAQVLKSGSIDWDAFRKIAASININDDDYAALVKTAHNNAAQGSLVDLHRGTAAT